MEVEIKGMKELLARLENARVQMGGPEMKKALRKGAKVIEEAMVERAPVLKKSVPGSSALPPGALKAGIRVYVPQDNSEPPQALIGPSAKVAHVARFVEYGHRSVSGGSLKLLGNGKTRGTGKAGADVPAHPFLRPAFEASIETAGAAIAASLTESYKDLLG
jgi:HK97 gp10 family phage protein